MTGDSRTDLEALRRSGNGKILALAVVLLGALGAAAWFLFFEPRGIGAAEEPDKVLVVRSGGAAGYSAVLDRGGFDAAEAGLEHWAEKARAEVPDLPEGSDVQAVIGLADHYGYGFVAFERPQDVDFSGLDIESKPDLDEHVRFAVLSIGDFAFPHVMTVNPQPSEALRRLDISLLQALFEQEPLAEALPDNESASVDAIQLRSKLEEAITDLGLVEAAEALSKEVAGEVERTLADERGSTKPVRLSSGLESGSAIPTPSSGVLVASRDNAVVTDNGIRAELSPADAQTLRFSSTPGEGAAPCEAVMGGAISATESPKLVSSPGGAFVLETLTHGQQLWVPGEGKGCAFTLRGSIPPTGLDDAGLLLPHVSGRLARVGTVDGEATIEILAVGEGSAQPRRVELTGVAVRDVAWLDAEHLAATADDGLLYLISTGQEAPLAVQPEGLGRDPTLYEVAALGETAVVLTVGSDPRRVVTLDAGRSWSALFSEPALLPVPEPVEPAEPVEPGDVPADEERAPSVRRIDPSGFETTVLTRAGTASQVVGSPDGTAVAFTLRDRTLDDPGKGDDAEIALVDVDGGAVRLLTRNVLPDHDPAFTADGAWVTMQTRIEVPRSSWRISVPRAVSVR